MVGHRSSVSYQRRCGVLQPNIRVTCVLRTCGVNCSVSQKLKSLHAVSVRVSQIVHGQAGRFVLQTVCSWPSGISACLERTAWAKLDMAQVQYLCAVSSLLWRLNNLGPELGQYWLLQMLEGLKIGEIMKHRNWSRRREYIT